MIKFKDYIIKEEEKQEDRDKLDRVNDLLKRTEGMDVYYFPNKEENSYIFVKFPVASKLYEKLREIKLGIRIYNLTDKLMFRLQQGPKGFPIGPAHVIQDMETIEDLISQGKNEAEAYNEIIRTIPGKIKNFMNKIYRNLEHQNKAQPISDKQMDIHRNILNSLTNIEVDPVVKK